MAGAGENSPSAGHKGEGTKGAPRILIVEDDALLGMAVEDALEIHGMEVAGIATSVNDALRTLETVPLDGAILDVSLNGQFVDELADALAERGVPFIFLTARRVDALPAAHRERPVVSKPFREADLAEEANRQFGPA